MTTDPNIDCDLLVIGAGMAGSAAALFAAALGFNTVQAGITSQTIFASGLMDLMGVHPVASGRVWRSPHDALAALAEDEPRHPLARVSPVEIDQALKMFTGFLSDTGLSYRCRPGRNVRIPMPTGTLKTTYCVPLSMWPGVKALEKQQPCLIVGVHGLRGFSARQISESLQPVWPGLRHANIRLPDRGYREEIFAEPFARSLAVKDNRRRFAEALAAVIGQKPVDAVAFPAMLGLGNVNDIIADIAKTIVKPLFEIPTMPPSIPGLRLKETLEEGLRQKGVMLLRQQRVFASQPQKDGFLSLVGSPEAPTAVRSRAVLLATGRFLGKGLHADRKKIRETLFDLPVHQPEKRPDWHRTDFLDSRGHPVNRSGIETDDALRPLTSSKQPLHPHLFAAGSILAHQDWMRAKCGAGLSIATAWKAVQSFKATAGF